MAERGPMDSRRWVHQLDISYKVLVTKETGQELFNIIRPQVSISGDTTEQLGRSKAASGGRRAPVGTEAVPQDTGRSILISISATLLLRCLPGFLLSCCQLGSADRSELLPAWTNRKA